MKNHKFFEINDLSFRISGTSILDKISFTVSEGEVVGVIGPNGSGKTTLFNAISGFIFPQSGTISFLGENCTDVPAYQRARRGLGRVFQQSGVFRNLTVEENLLLALGKDLSIWEGFLPVRISMKKYRPQAMELLEIIGLQKRAKDKAASLSGGQLRLLELARAEAFNAKVLLFDEPTAGVSPKMKDQVAMAIERLKSQGRTILVIEHDIAFISGFCSRILVLSQGRLVLDDTPENLRHSSLLHDVYFGGEKKAVGG